MQVATNLAESVSASVASPPASPENRAFGRPYPPQLRGNFYTTIPILGRHGAAPCHMVASRATPPLPVRSRARPRRGERVRSRHPAHRRASRTAASRLRAETRPFRNPGELPRLAHSARPTGGVKMDRPTRRQASPELPQGRGPFWSETATFVRPSRRGKRNGRSPQPLAAARARWSPARFGADRGGFP